MNNKIGSVLLIVGSVISFALTLSFIIYSYGIAKTYPRLFVVTLLTIIEWPLLILLVLYKFKNNIPIFHFKTYLDNLVFFIFCCVLNINFSNLSIMRGCLLDYQELDTNLIYLKDDYLYLYHFMIASAIFHFLCLISWIIKMKREKNVNVNNDLIELITRTRKEYIILSLTIIGSLIFFALSLLVFIKNIIIESISSVNYLYSSITIFEWPLLIFVIIYHLYRKTIIDFNKNFIGTVWIIYVVICIYFSMLSSLGAGSCIMPITGKKIADTNYLYYIWITLITFVNIIIYNVYLWKNKSNNSINNEESGKSPSLNA